MSVIKIIEVLWRKSTVSRGPGSLPRVGEACAGASDVLFVNRPTCNVPGQLFAAFSLLVSMSLQILVPVLIIPEGEVYLGHKLGS